MSENDNKVLNSLEKLSDVISNKHQNTSIISANGYKFTKSLSPAINLANERNYKAAVQSFSVYNAIRM